MPEPDPREQIEPRLAPPGATPEERLASASIARPVRASTLREAGLEPLLREAAFDVERWPASELDRTEGARIETHRLVIGGVVHLVLRDDYRASGLSQLAAVLRGLAETRVDPAKWVFIDETTAPGEPAGQSGRASLVLHTLADRTGVRVERAVRNIHAPEVLLGALERGGETSPPLDAELLLGCAAILRAQYGTRSPLDYFGAVNESAKDWGRDPDDEVFAALRLLVRGKLGEFDRVFAAFEQTVTALEASLDRTANFTDPSDADLMTAAATTGAGALTRPQAIACLLDCYARMISGGLYPHLGAAVLDISDTVGERFSDREVHDAVRRCYEEPRARQLYLSRRLGELTDEEGTKRTEKGIGALLAARPEVEVAVIVAHAKYGGSIARAIRSAQSS